jgi:hypothetical protein
MSLPVNPVHSDERLPTAAARLAADPIAGDPPLVDPSPFRYSRMIDGSRLVPETGL